MRALLLILPLLHFLQPLEGGRIVRLSSPRFSLQITEPDDWTLDFQTVAQIAHFALYRKEATWRNAEVMILARFVARQPEESAAEFLQGDEARFIAHCPFFEIDDVSLDVTGPQKYLLKSYRCPGAQNQIVAVTEVPSHFAIFVLSAQKDGPLEPGIEAFKEVLSGFRWLGEKPERSRDGPRPAGPPS